MIKKQHVKSRKICKLTFELPADLEGDAVYLLGEFNNWEPEPFKKEKKGSWKLVKEVDPGHDYQFRYMIEHGDHHHFFNDPEADNTVPNEHGSENAIIRC